jgi:hypothetical protein
LPVAYISLTTPGAPNDPAKKAEESRLKAMAEKRWGCTS